MISCGFSPAHNLLKGQHYPTPQGKEELNVSKGVLQSQRLTLEEGGSNWQVWRGCVCNKV